MLFGEVNGISRVYGESKFREPSFEMGDYHYHSFYELYYVERGSCQFFVNDSLYRLRQGAFILIPPEYLHYTKYRENCLRFSVYFRQDDITPRIGELLHFAERFSVPKVFTVPELRQGEIRKILDRMEQEEHYGDSYTAESMELLLNELLLNGLRFGTVSEVSPEDSGIYSEDAGILKTARYISAHYVEKLSQTRLAELSGYSPNYFSKRFKETTGIGAHEYLQLIRMKHAAELLRNSERSVLDIALSVGFSDGNYFKDAFKKIYGLPPREWRKSNK